MYTCTAKIVYSPNRPGLKKTNRKLEHFCVAEVDNNIAEYYRYVVMKGTGKILQGLAWRPHVTVVTGKEIITDEYLAN